MGKSSPHYCGRDTALLVQVYARTYSNRQDIQKWGLVVRYIHTMYIMYSIMVLQVFIRGTVLRRIPNLYRMHLDSGFDRPDQYF